MARKCEDIVPETANKTNFAENCKKPILAISSHDVVEVAAAASTSPSASSSKQLDEEADEILLIALNKIDSPAPSLRSLKGTDVSEETNSNVVGGGGGTSSSRRKPQLIEKTPIMSVKTETTTKSSKGSELGMGGAGAVLAGGSNDSTTVVVDDLGSTDEVKVFEDEGDRDDEKMSVEHMLEEKSSLIDFTENEVRTVECNA